MTLGTGISFFFCNKSHSRSLRQRDESRVFDAYLAGQKKYSSTVLSKVVEKFDSHEGIEAMKRLSLIGLHTPSNAIEYCFEHKYLSMVGSDGS
jgi:hypothetical protein